MGAGMTRAVHAFRQSEEMYLKTIAEMVVPGSPVPVTGLAERMGISTVSASEMVSKLHNRGFVIRTPYKGVELSPEGKQRADRVIRRHRLWECFLADRLGLPWAQVHDLACEMEHVTEPEVAQALAEHLEWPNACPHGNPIDYDESPRAHDRGFLLAELEVGQAAQILRIHPESRELLEYVQELGLLPGQPLELAGVAPFEGPLTLRIERGECVLGREAAAYIWVAPGC
jgi:DtxR family Mn-dependent transcriptional regulator